MKLFALALVSWFLVGCDYTVPLVAKPETKIDPAVLGVWEREMPDGKRERLLVLPLGETEYLVSFPAETADALYARACLGQVGEEPIIQLQWFGTARGALAKDERVYQYAVYQVGEGTLSVRMLNSETVSKEVKSPAELSRAIAEGMDEPDLFREPMVFQRVKQ